MKNQNALKLQNEFKKLQKIVDEQCENAGTWYGDFETVKTPETKRFITVQKELIKLGYEIWVQNKLNI